MQPTQFVTGKYHHCVAFHSHETHTHFDFFWVGILMHRFTPYMYVPQPFQKKRGDETIKQSIDFRYSLSLLGAALSLRQPNAYPLPHVA